MFKAITNENYEFEFKNKKFHIYNNNLIPELLGKTGNQTAINAAGSAWKKIIKRNETQKQKASEIINPKYSELKRLILNYIKIDKHLLEEGINETKKRLSENLKKFKDDSEYRKKCINEILNKDYSFRKNIPFDKFYILFSIYIAFNYNYFTKKEINKFSPIKFDSIENFKKKYLEILEKDGFKIENLTCFSYTQYFWIDYRLSESLDSEIHKIIFNIFNEINKEINIEEKNAEEIMDLKFDATEIKLRSLLSEEVQFIVPDYQREFSWEYNKEVRTFMKDFFEVFSDKSSIKYFLGSIVLIERDNYFEVIDGQQRLTTIIIFLSILKDLYSKEELKATLGKYINYDYDNEGKIEEKHKLILNKNNMEFFKRYFTARLSQNERTDNWKYSEKDSNWLIYKAYKEIKERLLENIDEINDENIGKIIKKLLDSFYLIKIIVPNEQMANKIFETLNDRGKPLKTYENIKNHIFGRVKTDFDVLRDRWNSLIRTYGSKSFENYMIQVYKSNYISNYKHLTKNNFFANFKSNTEIKDYHKFVSLLEEEISIFKNLLKPNSSFWENKDHFWNLKLIEAFEINSVYLTLLSSYKKDFYFGEILKKAVETVFRNEFSYQKPFDINVASTKISKQIRDFNEEDIESKKRLLNTIKQEFQDCIKPTDEQIKNNFLFGKMYNKTSRKNVALKILKIINQFENEDNSIDWNCFTVEHIYSQTNSSSNDFKKTIEQIEADYKKRYNSIFRYNENSIYNLTILPPPDNQSCSHENFEKKIEIYKKYINLPTNKKLSELYDKYKTFNLDLVEEYQQFLWEKITKIFHLT